MCFYKPHITSILFQNQTVATHKPKNTVTYVEKNINQSKSRRANTNTTNNLNQESPSLNSISEMKVDVAESVLNKNRRISNMETEIVKESICKGDTNASAVGKGKGKLMHNTYSEFKKARRTSGSEPSETNNVQNTSFQSSYNQVTKKKVDNMRKTDTTDNH